MRSRYKRTSAIGLGVGLPLVVGGIMLLFPKFGLPGVGAIAIFVGAPFYLWGCCALAKAKGYSTAIVLTAFFGLLFPMVVLLALPDKHKHYGGER
jgi:hypothetical protein